MESAEYGAAGERTAYGNMAGLDLPEGIHDTKDRMKRLEDQMVAQFADHQAQITRLQNRVNILTDRVNILITDAERYHNIRHRFIDVYRQDVLEDDTAETCDKIHDSNITAYEGDAITYARLYTTSQ